MVEGLKQHREIETFNGKRAITPLAGNHPAKILRAHLLIIRFFTDK